jgi:hypothetical protein
MPGFSASFFEFLIYIVPGFVVLYNLGHVSAAIETMFIAVTEGNGASTLVMLLFLAMAIGIVVAGIASIVVPKVSRFATKIFSPKSTEPLNTAQINFGKVYTRQDQAVRMFMHHMQVYRSYAHVAIAWLFSIAIFVWRKILVGEPVDHWKMKLCILFLFLIGMFWAAIQYFRHVFHIAHTLATEETPSQIIKPVEFK